MSELINLMDFDRLSLSEYFESIGEKSFRATQVIKWIYQEEVTDFQLMTNLSKALRDKLSQIACVKPPEPELHHVSNDGTQKWVASLGCNNRVETVFIPEKTRGTLCISSQVGCALACPFCSTAQQGFNRNLTTGEIIGQVWMANHSIGHKAVTNVVLMGMGEPLLNFDNVVKAINLMLEDNAYGLSKRRVTVSTSGIVPAIYRLKEVTDVSLALSLHAPNDALRDELVPINQKYPIEPLLEACESYIDNGEGRRRITIEYVMIDELNDTAMHARQLAKLLKNKHVKINLIPFNPFPGTDYKRSKEFAIQKFTDILMQSGFTVTTRRTRGDDIDAACGQLVGQVKDKSCRHLKFKKVVIKS
ncbi:MAG: 23S rRNA (adenine(2503)-C(2))-methyltransferase RlmN, partial [Methylococcales bacterium]|jgi:23S rRNA (adenine2503-C2)-methyltransferase|nr:23S rRNA (adenine(2503)-C(2))-methyltransferase RlmN [Methylococcales bacterium]MBT7445939.1 23S rRNA (adenine(2503)-C(2))-methyltransferase RlmN [Methylococcales bacterium]